MAFPNKYPGNCACGTRVAIGAGLAVKDVNGKWVNRCHACDAKAPRERAHAAAPREAVGPPTVRLTLASPSTIMIRPSTFLGDTFYAAFKVALAKIESTYTPRGAYCAACRTWAPASVEGEDNHVACATCHGPVSDARASSFVALSAVPETIAALRTAHLEVELTPDLATHLRQLEEKAKAAHDAAEAIVTKHDEFNRPRGLLMRPFQWLGSVACAANQFYLLADDMGLGKTIQAILSVPDGCSVIVLCPAVARGNWKREFHKWHPSIKAHIIEGRGALVSAPRAGMTFVASYDSMGETPIRVPDTAGPLVLIVDEAHNVKGDPKKVARCKRMEVLRDRVMEVGGRILTMTGTPIMNRLEELWWVLQASGRLGERLYGDRKRFKKMANDPEKFVDLLKQIMLRRTKEEVLKELPPKVFNQVDVEIDAKVREELDGLLQQIVLAAVRKKLNVEERNAVESGTAPIAPEEREAIVKSTQQDVLAAIELAFDGKIKVPFEVISRVKSLLAIAKAASAMRVLDELEENTEVDENGLVKNPLLFLSAHLEPVNMAASRPGWARLTGAETGDERDKLVDDFQAGRLRGLALTIKAGGVAITLHRSCRGVSNDREWNPALNNQAYDRLHRMGQLNTVFFTHVVANHVLDQRIAELLDEKQRLIQGTIEAAVRLAHEKAHGVEPKFGAAMAQTKVVDQSKVSTALERRTAKDEVERWAVSMVTEHGPQTDPFCESVRRQRDRGLTEKQWLNVVKIARALKARGMGAAAPDDRPFRANSPRRQWIADALLTLAANCDGARAEDGAGFNKLDSGTGKDMGLRAHGDGLTEGEWRFADRMLRKYRNTQVGAPPADPLYDAPVAGAKEAKS